MKKTALLFLSVLLLLGALPAASAEQKPTEIASREDLLGVASDPSGAYVLTADIDLGGEPWTPIPFSGVFDGAGHTIGNLTVRSVGTDTAVTYDGNYKEYESSFAGLFSVVRGAEIRDLHLVNADIRIETDRDCFLGAIAGYASDTVLTGCSVSMRGMLTLSSVDAGVGGLIGFSVGCTVQSCEADAELIFADVNPDVLCEEFLGGVFACGFGTVRGCSVHTRGYADIYGYAHNGGVIGMFKITKEKLKAPLYLRDTTVDAEIRFFEITPSRRAYCKALIGEDNIKVCRLLHNKELHFVSAESREPVPQRPETCAAPAYAAVVTEPTCTEWGYTTYTCEHCGYTYRDAYTLPRHSYAADVIPPTCTEEGVSVYTCTACGDTYTETVPPTGHTPGDWVVVREAAIGSDGEEQRACTVCGAVLETRAIPARQPIRAKEVALDRTALELHPDETARLHASVEPAYATDLSVRFESADPEVAAVDENGVVTALDEGVTEIAAVSADGYARAVCTVTVTRTFRQKLERFFSFSWLRCAND